MTRAKRGGTGAITPVEETGLSGSDLSPKIPTLRKKEKEKKGAGVAWSSGSPSSGMALVRTPAAVAFRGPLGLGRIAGYIAKVLGEQSVLGAAFASKMGGWLVLTAFLGAGAAAGLSIGSFMRAHAGKPAADAGLAPLAGVQASGAARSAASGAGSAQPADRASDGVATAGGGAGLSAGAATENGPQAAPASGAASSGGAAASGAGAETSDFQGLAALPAGSQGIATAPGMADASPMAPGTVMGMVATMRNAITMAAPPAARAIPRAAGHQKLGKFPKQRTAAGKQIDSTRVSSRVSMGALKWAKLSSMQGKVLAPTEEAASRYERNAFEMTRTNGGTMSAPADVGLPQVVSPMGGGALNDGVQPAPDAGPSKDFTPYQPQIDNAKNLSNAARKNHNMGVAMMFIGALLLALGAALMAIAPMLGGMLLATGMMLITQGVQHLAIAQNQSHQADRLGKNIQQDYSQTKQGQIVSDCARVSGQGRRCHPPPFQWPADTVPEATERVSKQTYTEGN